MGPKYVRQHNEGLLERAFELQILKRERRAVGPPPPEFDAFWRAFEDQQPAQSAFIAERDETRHCLEDCRRDLWCAQMMLPEDSEPHEFIVDKLAELSALQGLAALAFDTFEKSWVNSGGGGQKGKFRSEMPGRWLAQTLIDLIYKFWGISGVEHISAAREGKNENDAGRFNELLVAFHQYAMGSDGTSLVEALTGVNEMIDLYLSTIIGGDRLAADLAKRRERGQTRREARYGIRRALKYRHCGLSAQRRVILPNLRIARFTSDLKPHNRAGSRISGSHDGRI